MNTGRFDFDGPNGLCSDLRRPLISRISEYGQITADELVFYLDFAMGFVTLQRTDSKFENLEFGHIPSFNLDFARDLLCFVTDYSEDPVLQIEKDKYLFKFVRE